MNDFTLILEMSLGLLGAYNSSSESDSSSDSEKDANPDPPPKKVSLSNPFNNPEVKNEAKILPRPSFMVEQEDLAADKSKKTHENSVFSNPFRAREDQKKAILEQHVTMTTKQEDQRTIGKCLSCLFNSESKLFNLCF